MRTKKELDDLHKEKRQLLLTSQKREIAMRVCNMSIISLSFLIILENATVLGE